MIGWIYWDPRAIANYEALGVPNGFGYYVSTRAATLGEAGNKAVSACFYSIHPDFIKVSLDNCREYTTFEKAAAARDAAVAPGLKELTPEICEPLATMSPTLWKAAEELPVSGRALFASLLDWPRHEDPLTSAWLAVNAIREWRGDTHWAIMTAKILTALWREFWIMPSMIMTTNGFHEAEVQMMQQLVLHSKSWQSVV